MKQALKNIFAQQEVKTSSGVVERRLSKTRIAILDPAGRIKIVDVDSDKFYPPGAKVAVQYGRVIGPAGVMGNVKKVMV